MSRLERLARISVNSADADTLASFYQRAFGFFRISSPVKKVRALALGQTRLDIVDVGATARRYPEYIPCVQHCVSAFRSCDDRYGGIHAPA